MTVSQVTCPLCGKSNACGMAAGQASCWCFDARIDQETLDRIPEEARGVACLCSACAAGAGKASMAKRTNEP